MGVHIDIVAQSAMDRYYGSFKASVEYWDIDDFKLACGFAWGTVMQRLYQALYAEAKSEKTDSLVAFDPLILNDQILEVKKEGGRLYAKFTHPVMSFGFSDQSVGVQGVTIVEPSTAFGDELERYTKQSAWQIKSLPFLNKIFFRVTKEGIELVKKGFCNVTKVAVSYVPAATKDGDYEIAEGFVDEVIAEAITLIREGRIPVIKKTLDQNQNAVLETEINKESLK